METLDQPDITALSPGSFARFAEFITSELGIKMPESKITMIQSRLLRRVRDLGLGSVEQYSDFFFSSPDAANERSHFINAVTTNKTDFFREPQHFDYLLQTALPAILSENAGQQGDRIAVWSAGCSSGEEPYTLAMLLSEFATNRPDFDFAVLATDVSTRVLERARAAIYEESQAQPVPLPLRRKYLLRSKPPAEKLVRVVPQLRRKVSFHALNFMDASYPIKELFQIVFCRNVLIYFEKSTQEIIINKICQNLAPGGYLFIGHSESLSGLQVPITQVRGTIYRKPPRGRYQV